MDELIQQIHEIELSSSVVDEPFYTKIWFKAFLIAAAVILCLTLFAFAYKARSKCLNSKRLTRIKGINVKYSQANAVDMPIDEKDTVEVLALRKEKGNQPIQFLYPTLPNIKG